MRENRVFEMMLAGRNLKVEVGKFANLANGSALMTYGDTSVLVTATASRKPREGIDFFPLSVEFEEKMYAAGKIPGGFLKREGRPSERAVLSARLIDRPIRPLFPEGVKNEVQVIATVFSVDQDNEPDVLAMNGSSVALCISDIPFGGPACAVNVGYIDGEYITNPNVQQREKSRLNLTVSGTRDAVVMVEAGADILSEDIMLGAIAYGHSEIKKICAFVEDIAREVGKAKFEIPEQIKTAESQAAAARVEEFLRRDMKSCIAVHDKTERGIALDNLRDAMKTEFEEFAEEFGGDFLGGIFKSVESDVMRKMVVLDKVRADGRTFAEIRPVSTEVAVLPRTHGSGVFNRGLTQAMTVTTLGALAEAQRLDGLDTSEETKRYIHHYNFPPFSVGETGFARVNRRAVGHGALAERALLPVIPSEEDFPYAIRLVSEILTCNGSSSQASICGSSLSLMDAGVPIKAAVAGIAMGLIQEEGEIVILSDIQGMEDALGDMDFKVAGTKDGITALQMDIKIDGLSQEILEAAMEQARQGRLHILEKMNEAISAPREDLSPLAPRVFKINIDPDKIREVIGTGGKVVQKISADFNVKVDIDDSGLILITAENAEGGNGALNCIKGIVEEPEVGQVYTGKVTRILKFGAFVEIGYGREGLCHISQLEKRRINRVEDSVNIGDEIEVKIIEVDDQGRINLSRKVLL